MNISIAIFAYNEEDNIERCIRSVFSSTRSPEKLEVKVIINGTRDSTKDIVEKLTYEFPGLSFLDIEMGDKSNAWNVFVYGIQDFKKKFYFLDGDNWLPAYSLDFINEAFDTDIFNAIAPTPIGISESLREMLVRNKFISGNFYGVSGSFLENLVIKHQFKLPIGFIGDDSLVMYLLQEGIGGKDQVKDIKVLQQVGPVIPRVKIDFNTFNFAHSRYKRYAVRHFQQEIFYFLAKNNRLNELPKHAAGLKKFLFKIGPKPFLKLCGVQTLYHPYAILKILFA